MPDGNPVGPKHCQLVYIPHLFRFVTAGCEFGYCICNWSVSSLDYSISGGMATGLRWSSAYWSVRGGGRSITYSLHLQPLRHVAGFRIDKLSSHKRSLLQSPMYSVIVVVPLPTRWDIPWLPDVSDTHPPFRAYTKYPSPLAAIGDWQLGFSGVHHTIEALPVAPLARFRQLFDVVICFRPPVPLLDLS